MYDGEPDLIADAVIAPDFARDDLVVFAQAASDVDHAGGYVQMEGHAKLRQVRPLRERLEMIDRLARLDLDDDLQLVAAVE